MALKLRVGVSNMPKAGDTLSVYYTGTTNLLTPIFTPDSIGATLSNPFTVPSSGWYGFEPATTDRVDVYWHEENRNLVEDVNARDMSLALPLDQSSSPMTGQSLVWDGNKFVYDNIVSSSSAIVRRYFEEVEIEKDTFPIQYSIIDGKAYVDVFLNGVKLAPTEFTATNGTSVVLNSPVTVTDPKQTIELIASLASGADEIALSITRTVYTYTATVGQTEFDVIYRTIDDLDVYLEGHRLSNEEYSVSNGSKIILTDPCVGGEFVEIISFTKEDEIYNPLTPLSLSESIFDTTFEVLSSSLFGSLSGPQKWHGGVLAPNGKIYGIPYESTQVLEIDPISKTTTLFGSLSGANKWLGGVLAPNGKIYGIPSDSTQVLEIDPISKTTATFGSLSSDQSKWLGGVLAPNGKIYGIPHNSTQVLEIDPVLKTTVTFGSLSSDQSKWLGGVLAPNGKIYGIPRDSTQVLEIDPVSKTTTLFGSFTGTNKWSGGVLAPNGKIYGIPRDSTQVLEIELRNNKIYNWMLSPYSNKF